MGLESINQSDSFLDDLNSANPLGDDPKNQGDQHIRGVKNVLLNTLPNLSAEASMTAKDLNFLAGLSGQGVLNKLIGGDSDSKATAISVGPGLSMNSSAGHVLVDLSSLSSEQSVGATINYADSTLKRPKVVDYAEGLYDHGIISQDSSLTLDLELGNRQVLAVQGSPSISLNFANWPASDVGGEIQLAISAPGRATWSWGSVKWPSGTAPAFATSGNARIVFYTENSGARVEGVYAEDLE